MAERVCDGPSASMCRAVLQSNLQFQSHAALMKALNVLALPPTEEIQQGYYTDQATEKVVQFLELHKEPFDRVESETGVDRTIVASLLWIETLLGSTALKTYPTIDSLVSLAVFSDPSFRAWALPILEKEATIKIDAQEPRAKKLGLVQKKVESIPWDQRMTSIGEDWEKHTKAYFEIAHILKWDETFARSRRGSWAGAIGYSQFMPATLLPYVRKKSYQLWEWSDAIELTSKELAKKGFSMDIEKSLKAYNSPTWYRSTILKLHSKLLALQQTFAKR
ncbi:MAG: lytic murein transglycosylase [Bdellovibrionota bacterium]